MLLHDLLASGRRIQLDGGLSTALEELGADLDDPLWTARILRDQPELVLAAHRAFVDAGAEVVISASYQAPLELLAESVRIARASGALVAASVAPYGASLAGGQEYTGDFDVPAGWHERRVAALIEAGPDFLAIETQPRADEAAHIASLVHDLDCWVTFTCRDGERTGHGERIEDAVGAVVAHDSVAAVGVNCTAPEFMDELLNRIRSVTDLPLVAYPNAGRAYDAATKTWSGAAQTWSGAAALVGGCCGIGPAALSEPKGA
ncbi:homocysteine S-methyltransferase [Solirubrobacter soli]|uniref:homocysteine S-methyltransferase n=1 Tax=Solirubrobacter soli TaxID=363832 RepID=UPI00041245BB|nr:homocysteine S-methyltransferase [Solirubrobacter soli]